MACTSYLPDAIEGMEYQTLSIADLGKRTNINLSPKLPAQIKEVKMELPPPARGTAREKSTGRRGLTNKATPCPLLSYPRMKKTRLRSK
jgi:hypothetical protein